MYSSLIAFLAVILLYELYAPSPLAAAPSWRETILGLVVSGLLFYGTCRVVFRRWEKGTSIRSPWETDALSMLHASLTQRLVILAVGGYALILYLFRWKIVVWEVLGGDSPGVASGLLGVLPFILLLAFLWAASYPSRRVIGDREDVSLPAHLLGQFKLHLPILFPWLGVLLAMDLLALAAPAVASRIEGDPLLAVLAFLGLLVVLAWSFPWLVVKVWRCPSLPHGPARRRLEQFFARNRFRYAGMVQWTLLEGTLSTAGILGIFPRTRYILVTPSLLKLLDEEELEAVMAHEMGHARHRHMLFYLLFMLGLTVIFELGVELLAVALTWAAAALEVWGKGLGSLLQRPDTASTLISLGITVPALGLVLAYFRFGFGLFSRHFERQSDLHALQVQGTSLPLIRAFQKISGFNPFVRKLPSWHHFSIQQRMDFLRDCEIHPELIARHHRKVRGMVLGYLVFFLLSVTLLAGIKIGRWGDGWTLALLQGMLERRLEHHPRDPALWLALGNVAMERSDTAGAERAYRRVLSLDPHDAEALNNLAWLYATSQDTSFRKPQEALRLAETAARLAPSSPHILDTLAEAYFINGRYKEAVEVERRALSLAREDRDYYRRQLERFLRGLASSS